MKNKPSKSEQTKIKKQVRERDEFSCQHCGCWLGDSRGDVHHIVYLSRGGTWELWNLLLICGELDNPECIAHWKIHNGHLYCKTVSKSPFQVEFSSDKFED